MMNKPISFLIVLWISLTAMVSNAQNSWAPEGAEWYFQSSSIVPESGSYERIASIHDTTINAQACMLMLRQKPDMLGNPLFDTDTLYMYSSAGKVYYYKADSNHFNLLYDFSKNAGEYWILDEYSAPDDTVFVDSVSTISINSIIRKVQYVHMRGLMIDLGPRVIEGIGCTNYMFPQADMNYLGPLRCYSDSIVGLFKNNYNYPCDTVFFGGMSEISQQAFSIAPNPANDRCLLSWDASAGFSELEIFDVRGQMILKKSTEGMSDYSFSVREFRKGMYLIHLNSSKGNKAIQKLIIL
jgi:hypothetical protein